MQIEILKHPTEEDWMYCKQCTLVTVGKTAITPPTDEWKRKILAARHSPIRVLEFGILIRDIPSYISVHLCRHVHAQPFVKTQRNDRQDGFDRRKAPQDQPVDMIWHTNAEELMTVANKRLCTQAAPETRAVVKAICDEVIKVNPEFDGLLVPMCAWRGGRCDEFNCCGLNRNYQHGEERVYCTDCEYFDTDGDFLRCAMADKCNFYDPEDNRRLIDRPCYVKRT